MELFFQHLDVVAFIILFFVGLVVGRLNERRHYADIRARETELAHVLVFSNRFPPQPSRPTPATLVTGSVVISDDYFKSVLAAFQNFFGGNLRTYESLVDRARREAVLRMKDDARRHGAAHIFNVKFQTFAIPGRRPNSIRGVELLVYGTAVAPEARSS